MTKKTRKFKVWARYYHYCFVTINASTKKQAEEKANDLGGLDFMPDDSKQWMDDGGWEIVNELTEEIK
jgi:hypothetical protein